MQSTEVRRKNKVSAVGGWLSGQAPFSELMLPALTVLFGLQVLRMLVPSLTWLLGDRFGLGAMELGAVSLLIFIMPFSASGLRRLLNSRRLIIITAGGLGLLRLFMQVGWGEPFINLILAMAGTICFILFIPVYLDDVRVRGHSAPGLFALGLLIGVTLDTTLHGAFSTYDTVWQPDLPALLLTVALVLIQWLLLFMKGTNAIDFTTSKTDGSLTPKSLAWLAIGPFLFLQLVVFQNVARLAVLTNWPLPFAFGWTLMAQLLALVATVWIMRTGLRRLWPLALTIGIILIAISAFPYPQQAWLAAFMLLLGQISLALLIVVVIIGVSNCVPGASFSSVTIASGLGMILLVVFLLGYYAVYQITLPYSNTILEPVAAAIVTACAVASSITLYQDIKVNGRAWLVAGLAMVLLVLPLFDILTWQEPEANADDGFPVRIMTYNLHNGFNTDGYLDMEAIVQVIENNNPDIIALQEISRGWVISGRLDMLTWLSQRLDMPYISGPTADPLWGNALLSRYPILEYKSYELPPRDLFILRGFTSAEFNLGNGSSLQVIATHFHHLAEDSDIRQMQSTAIVDFWNGVDRTIILGDFNAEPDAPEIDTLCQAGLMDALINMEPHTAFTYHSADPYQRIDYIWVSPDLEVQEVCVPFSNASDHLPVLAVINN